MLSHHPDVPEEVLRMEKELEEAEPEVNPWACLILLAITAAFMGVTAEFVGHNFLSTLRAIVLTLPCSSLRV